VPEMPAFCDNCGTVFGSGIVLENCRNISLNNCVAGPCPNCRGNGRVPDGVYDATNSVITLITGTLKTITQLKQLSIILANAQRLNQSRDQVDQAIQKEVPELNSLASILPKTRIELYAFLTIILMAIGIILSNSDSNNEELSEPDIPKLMDNAIQKSITKPNNNTQQQPGKKQGRNEPCVCGSGNKFKRCCIQFI
jgi:hypothetical protein